MKKTKTYMDKLMENKEFREKFNKEYQNLCVGEKIAKIRHQVNLKQDIPVNRIKIIKHFKYWPTYKKFTSPTLPYAIH